MNNQCGPLGWWNITLTYSLNQIHLIFRENGSICHMHLSEALTGLISPEIHFLVLPVLFCILPWWRDNCCLFVPVYEAYCGWDLAHSWTDQNMKMLCNSFWVEDSLFSRNKELKCSFRAKNSLSSISTHYPSACLPPLHVVHTTQ